MADCIVIGAGMAGLAAADALDAAGVRVTVLEQHDRVGGRVWSDRMANGALVERGAEFITDDYDTTDAYVERLGLAYAGMGIRYPDRELRPDPGIDRAAALAAARCVAAAAVADPTAPALAVLDAVVEDPAIHELFASRIQSSTSYPIESVRAASLAKVEYLLLDEETRRIRGGNVGIAERLAAGLGDAVRLGERVSAIRHSDGGVEVDTQHGTYAADACVVAVPAPTILAIAFAPPLPDGHIEAIASLPFGSAAKLAVPLVEPAAANAIMSVPDRYWAYTTPCDEVGGRTLGSWAGALPVVELLRAREGAGVWLERVRELWPELPAFEPDAALVTTWTADEWAGGSYSVVTEVEPDGLHASARAVNRIAFAGEHTAPAGWTATIEGALRSGQRAAAEVIALVGDTP